MLLDQIPSGNELLKNFRFIKNRTLRGNIAVYIRYLTFLIVVREQEHLRGSIAGSIYKDVVIYTAAIVEGCLNYALVEIVKKGLIDPKQVCDFQWTNVEVKELHIISDTERICGIRQVKKYDEIHARLQFQSILRVALRSKILGRQLFNECDKLKEMRNTIHLASLEDVDGHYSKNDIEFAFRTANKVIAKVRRLFR